jgi:ABC-type branched-subunit amino acid transport system permease subunit
MMPSKSVPGGCVIAFFGLGAWCYGALAGWAAWRVAQKDPTSEHLTFLIWSGAAAILLGLILLVIGWRLAMSLNRGYDPGDRDEPRVKF